MFRVTTTLIDVTIVVLCVPYAYDYNERRRVKAVLCRPPPMSKPQDDLKKTWNRDQQATVQGALTERPGNVVVLAGEPGTGKSTILKRIFQEHTSVLYHGVLYFNPKDGDDFTMALADMLGCAPFYKPNWFRRVFTNVGIIPAHSVTTTSEELLDVCLHHLETAVRDFTAAQGAINGRPTFIVELGSLEQSSPVLVQKFEAFGARTTAEGLFNVILVKNKQTPSTVTYLDDKAAFSTPANISVVEVPDLTVEQAWEYVQQCCTAHQLQAYPDTQQFIEEVVGGRLHLLKRLVDWVQKAKGASLEGLRKDILRNCQNVFQAMEVDHAQAVQKVVAMLLSSAKDGYVNYADMLAAVGGNREVCKKLVESKPFSYHSHNRSVTFSSTAYKTAAKEMRK